MRAREFEPNLKEQRPQMKFLRPGELRGSFTDADMIGMGFRRAQNGAWYISQARWDALVAAGQLKETKTPVVDMPVSENSADAKINNEKRYPSTLDVSIEMHREAYEELLELDFSLFENKEELEKIYDIMRDFKTPATVAGRQYVYASFVFIPMVNVINLAHFEAPHTLIKKIGNDLYFEVNGKIRNFPEKGTSKYQHIFCFETVEDLQKVISWVQLNTKDWGMSYKNLYENFADNKKPGRRGLAKRMGVNCKQSVSKLRTIAKNSSGERQRMAHWCANMKAGRAKKK